MPTGGAVGTRMRSPSACGIGSYGTHFAILQRVMQRSICSVVSEEGTGRAGRAVQLDGKHCALVPVKTGGANGLAWLLPSFVRGVCSCCTCYTVLDPIMQRSVCSVVSEEGTSRALLGSHQRWMSMYRPGKQLCMGARPSKIYGLSTAVYSGDGSSPHEDKYRRRLLQIGRRTTAPAIQKCIRQRHEGNTQKKLNLMPRKNRPAPQKNSQSCMCGCSLRTSANQHPTKATGS